MTGATEPHLASQLAFVAASSTRQSTHMRNNNTLLGGCKAFPWRKWFPTISGNDHFRCKCFFSQEQIKSSKLASKLTEMISTEIIFGLFRNHFRVWLIISKPEVNDFSQQKMIFCGSKSFTKNDFQTEIICKKIISSWKSFTNKTKFWKRKSFRKQWVVNHF